MIQIDSKSDLLKLPEQLYGTIKRVGILNKEPILYGDPNLLKNGDLYYILGAELVYRYVKIVRSNSLDPSLPDEPVEPNDSKSGAKGGGQDPEDQSTYHTYLYFDTIDTPSTDELSVTEDERGHIRNAGYLFNEIIYSGDANLVDNGCLFYHSLLPFVSVVSNIDGNITLSYNQLDDKGDIDNLEVSFNIGFKTEQTELDVDDNNTPNEITI